MHRTHVANTTFAVTLCLFALSFCESVAAQASASLFQRVPVSFEENRGQFASDSHFIIHTPSARMNLKATQLELHRAPVAVAAKATDARITATPLQEQLSAAPLVMTFANANRNALPKAGTETARKSHYIFNDSGREPKLITARHFRSVRVPNIYPGIDALYYGAGGDVEYDLIVQPNADPGQVRLQFHGATPSLDGDGNIRLDAAGETVLHRSPVVFQEGGNAKSKVTSHYVRNADGTYGIKLGKHDPRRVLTIDPVISFATYLGGRSADHMQDLTIDSSGRALFVGQAQSFDFPLRNNLLPNPPDVTSSYFNLGYVTRFNRSGTDIEFSTFVAVSATSFVRLDDAGNIYVAATANAQTGAVAAALNAYKPTGTGAHILKLAPNGDAILGATYIGSTSQVTGLAVNGSGAIAVSGTLGTDGSVTPTSGSWITTPTGNLGYVAKLQPSLGAVDFVTYAPEAGHVALDASSNVYIAGGTTSATYPVTAGAFQTVKKDFLDAFVTKLSSAGNLLLSTFIGSNRSGGFSCQFGDDWATSIAIGADGGVYVAGRTMSDSSPGGDNPFTASRYYEWNKIAGAVAFPNSEDSRAFLVKLAPNFASLAFSGSVITSRYYAQGASQASCLASYSGGTVKVHIDNNQNIYLFAKSAGNEFRIKDYLHEYGDTVLVVDSGGQRIGATKLLSSSVGSVGRDSRYAMDRATGAIHFSAWVPNNVQSTVGLQRPSFSGDSQVVMKVVNPLAVITLSPNFNPSTTGQALTLTATGTSLPAGGTFVLKRDGVEINRIPATGASTTFTIASLQAGIYALTASYELPDQGGTIVSRTLAQVVNQTAVCP
jgi:hypothetical protein